MGVVIEIRVKIPLAPGVQLERRGLILYIYMIISTSYLRAYNIRTCLGGYCNRQRIILPLSDRKHSDPPYYVVLRYQ